MVVILLVALLVVDFSGSYSLGLQARAQEMPDIGFESVGYDTARWVASDDPRALKDFLDKNKSTMGTDRQGSPVFFANSRWALDRAAKNYPDIRFLATREMG